VRYHLEKAYWFRLIYSGDLKTRNMTWGVLEYPATVSGGGWLQEVVVERDGLV
jgi:hypothetical protein